MLGLEHLFIWLITFFADFLGNNYGLSVLFMTLLIRFLLLPLFIKQEKQQTETQEKMKKIQPILAKLQEKMKKAKTNEEKMAIQLEMQSVYKDHNIGFMSMGFLPALVQMPVFMGFYSALKHSVPISEHHFLWFSLGSSDIWLTLIVGILFFLQMKTFEKARKTTTEQPTINTSFMSFLFPIIMIIFAYNMPAAICLYWIGGSIFMILYKLISIFKNKNNS